MIKKILFLSLIAVEYINAASYIVPLEYDNIRLSVKSSGYGIITGATSTLSTNNYTIGGKSVKYRCITVPKIRCATGLATITPSLSEVSIRETTNSEVVTVWSADIRVEEDTSANTGNWFICGAAYGGEMSDNSVVTVVPQADGSRNLTYKYEPNINRYDIFAFVDTVPTYPATPGAIVTSNAADATSYMTVEYRQVCR